MSANKHQAVWDWLMTCPHIGDLFFNASRAEDGNTQLIPSERVVERFIDGSARMSYDCELTRFVAYSADPNDERNIESLVDFRKVAKWIDEQWEAGNLPAFPEGETIEEIELLPNTAGYMVAQDLSLAKYSLQFRIEYTKE